MAYADFELLVTNLVRDDEARITPDQLASAIGRATTRYTADKPRMKVVDVVAAGGHVLALPGGWEADVSQLIAIESPVGNNPPTYLERDSYQLYLQPDDSQVIRFVDALPIAAVRMAFTVSQVLSADPDQDTIPVADREAVCKYAAAALCDELAALYSNSSDSTIQADAVQYQNKASQRRAQASAYRKQYLDHLGIDEKQSQAAGVVVAVPLRDSFGGQRLFHGRNKVLH